MEKRCAPLAWPCLAVVAGCWTSGCLVLPIGGLMALIVLACALSKHPVTTWLRWYAAGAILTVVTVGPSGAPPWVDEARPVSMLVEVEGHARVRDGDLLVRGRVVRARQGERVTRPGCRLDLTLPAASVRPAPGARLRVRGYVRPSARYRNGAHEPPRTWRMRVASDRFVTQEGAPPWVGRLAHRWRLWAEHGIGRLAESSTSAAALVKALVLGDSSDLPEPLIGRLRRVGLGHLLAVSGLHLGLAALGAWLLTLPLAPRLRLIVVLCVVGSYGALVGARPSVLRAGLMAALAVLAMGSDRPPSGRNALAVVVLTLTLVDPAILGDLGFRLSVAATAGILWLGPAFERRWSWMPGWLRRPLAVTAAAQLATMPFAVPAFAAVTPGAAALNLVAVPWLSVSLVVAFVGLVAVMSWPPAAQVVAAVSEVCLLPLDLLATWPGAVQLAVPVAPKPMLGWLVAAVGTLFLLRPRRAAPWLLVLVALGLRHGVPATDPELWLLDVGQGDAILLRDGRHAMLVDGGGWPRGDIASRVLLPALAVRGVDRLDVVALTHPDADHCNGLASLARLLPVDTVLLAPGWEGEPCAARLLSTPGARWRPSRRGDRLSLGRWHLEILHPSSGEAGASSRSNDRSLVVRATARGRSFLLTGDVERVAERALLRAVPEALPADVLKVAHHGSKTSTSSPFLAAVSPRIALISAGRRNPYGHPTKVVLDRLRATGVWTLRTDRGGAIGVRVGEGGVLRIARPPVRAE